MWNAHHIALQEYNRYTLNVSALLLLCGARDCMRVDNKVSVPRAGAHPWPGPTAAKARWQDSHKPGQDI